MDRLGIGRLGYWHLWHGQAGILAGYGIVMLWTGSDIGRLGYWHLWYGQVGMFVS